MTHEVYIGFHHSCVDDLVAHLKALPEPLRPIYFTYGERVRNKSDRLDDEERFSAFYEEARRYGFA